MGESIMVCIGRKRAIQFDSPINPLIAYARQIAQRNEVGAHVRSMATFSGSSRAKDHTPRRTQELPRQREDDRRIRFHGLPAGVPIFGM